MSFSATRRLSAVTRLSILLAGVASVAAPLLYGIMYAAATAAPTADQTLQPTAAEIAHRKYEQSRPQKEVPFKPSDFDKFVGYYRFGSSDNFAHAYRDGDRYFLQMTGQQPVEQFPEGPTEFFATAVAAQASYVIGPGGKVTGLVIHQNGMLVPASRVSKAVYDQTIAALARRIKANVPSPGTEASLRRWIAAIEAGHPNYGDMAPGLAAAAREQAPRIAQGFRELGAFKSLAFVRVDPTGWDDYVATFANGQAEIHIAPLAPDGKVTGRFWQRVP